MNNISQAIVLPCIALLFVFALSACSDQSDAPSEQEEADQVLQAVEQLKAAYAAQQAEFLEANAAKDGVVVTDSGLQYRILEQGSGDTANPEDQVVVHYKGTLIDGTEFDSSYSRGKPATFAANRLIPGWVEALSLMQEGDKWELVIPADLAYGDNRAGDLIPGGSTLVFEMELLDVIRAGE